MISSLFRALVNAMPFNNFKPIAILFSTTIAIAILGSERNDACLTQVRI